MPVRYILSSVWVRLSIFSQLSIIQYVELCLFSSPFPLWSLIEYIYIHIYILCVIIIIKSEVWTIAHCLGLGHETMVCAVCLSIFLYVKALSDLSTPRSVGAQTPLRHLDLNCVRLTSPQYPVAQSGHQQRVERDSWPESSHMYLVHRN